MQSLFSLTVKINSWNGFLVFELLICVLIYESVLWISGAIRVLGERSHGSGAGQVPADRREEMAVLEGCGGGA